VKIIGGLDTDLSLADITSVVAGTGLSGGGTTGAVTLNVDAAQTGITSVGTIGTGTWQGTPITHEYINADQRGITTVGTITTGVWNGTDIVRVGTIAAGTWQGTAVASAYLDADTAHYSAQKQLTYYMFRADIDTTKTYVGLQEADGESTSASNKNLPILAPVAGKLLKVFLRANNDLSGKELTWRLETHSSSSATSGTPTVVGTLSGSGCTASSMTTYDFTEVDSNAIVAGDTVQLSIESDGTTANTTYFITCLWEWDLS